MNDRIKIFLVVLGIVWGIGIPFALYYDSIVQAPFCEGPNRYSGEIISSRSYPTPQYSESFSITHKEITVTSYQSYTPLYIYFSPDGTQFFVTGEPRTGFEDWMIVETVEYGIVKVCIIKN